MGGTLESPFFRPCRRRRQRHELRKKELDAYRNAKKEKKETTFQDIWPRNSALAFINYIRSD